MHHFAFVSKASHRHAYASVVDIVTIAAAAEIDSNLFMIFPCKMECYDNAMTKKPNQETASIDRYRTKSAWLLYLVWGYDAPPNVWRVKPPGPKRSASSRARVAISPRCAPFARLFCPPPCYSPSFIVGCSNYFIRYLY
jgi:hypothetical protein